MLRSHRTTILGTLLCILAGIGIALIWHGVTGRTEMPWWFLLTVVLLPTLLSDLVGSALHAWMNRRRRMAAARRKVAP